jgi:site-specific DNA-adenine methylase
MNETSKRKPDLFKIAHQNARRIENQFKVIKNNYRDEEKVVLEAFLDFVEKNWCISINLKPSEVTGFLISGKYKNMYQVIEEDLKELREEQGRNISKEEAAKNRMGFFYEKRKTFENRFRDSDRFIYAAFNIGGLGLKKYGNFSLIIHQKKVEKLSSCAFLKKESIAYVENNGLNIAQLKKDTADRETVHLLAAIKNEEKVQTTSAKEWPKIVCSENN